MKNLSSSLLRIGACVLALASLLPANVAAQAATGFRFNDMDLREPHVFMNLIFCRDITDTPLGGFSVNNELQTAIQTDGDMPLDGQLDLSLLIAMTPLDQSLATNRMQFGGANCTSPLASTTCWVTAPQLDGTATLRTTGDCLAPMDGTPRPYVPRITNTASPCFVSPTGTLLLDVGGLSVPLEDAQLAATFVLNPANNLVNGLLRGFLRETVADTTPIPEDFPLVAGQMLSSVLPGGTGACAAHNDKDMHHGVPGWWFYFNFTAPRVTIVMPLSTLLMDGFE